MAIKYVGELVDAWIRGYWIICNACECKEVISPLIFDQYGEPGDPEIGPRIYHEGSDQPLAFWWNEKRKWLLNSGAGWTDEMLLENITIIPKPKRIGWFPE